MFDFSEALRRMKLGAKVHRAKWDKGCYVRLEHDEFVWIYQGNEYTDVFTPQARDMVADDWVDPAE